MKHIQRYTSAGVLVTHFLVLLLINSFVLGALLPASAELGLDAFRLGKERLGKGMPHSISVSENIDDVSK